MTERDAGSEDEFRPGRVRGVGPWVVGRSNGEFFAVGRRCRHLGADLAKGAVDKEGCLVCLVCLVCPWHGARFDVTTGRMTRGPQGVFAKVPGLGAFFTAVTRVLPLPRRKVEVRAGRVVVDG